MKKKILHIIETLGTGGAERSLVENIALMRDWEHVVVILSGPEDFRDALASSGARLINLETNKRSILGNALKLRSIIRETEPALIHTSLYYANQAGRIAARLAGVPVLSSIVNTSYDPIRYQYEPALTPWKHNVLKMVDRATAAVSQCHFMAITDCVKQSAMRYTDFPAQRISVIHRGVDLEKYSSAERDPIALREAQGLADSYPVLLNIGRLMPQKGQRFIIEAMPAILERYPTARLLFAGTGYLLEELQAMTNRLGVQRHVTFLGKRNDIADLHAASDLFVFPSIWEGLGVSLIEAMAMGKPVVATNAGPFPEIVEAGSSGLLVDTGSADAVADAVIEMSASKERLAAMGQRSRAIAEAKFDIRKNARQLERLYLEMTGRGEITVGI
jgi:glycosyltransferase involved in cell wall biosynthesis